MFDLTNEQRAKLLAGSYIEDFAKKHNLTLDNLYEELSEIDESTVYELVKDALDMYLNEMSENSLLNKYCS